MAGRYLPSVPIILAEGSTQIYEIRWISGSRSGFGRSLRQSQIRRPPTPFRQGRRDLNKFDSTAGRLRQLIRLNGGDDVHSACTSSVSREVSQQYRLCSRTRGQWQLPRRIVSLSVTSLPFCKKIQTSVVFPSLAAASGRARKDKPRI